MTAEQMMAAVFGSQPCSTGTSAQTYTKPIYAIEVWEDTVIHEFKDAAGEAVTTGWEDVTIKEGKTIYLGASSLVVSITATTGGAGQVYLSNANS